MRSTVRDSDRILKWPFLPSLLAKPKVKSIEKSIVWDENANLTLEEILDFLVEKKRERLGLWRLKLAGQ